MNQQNRLLISSGFTLVELLVTIAIMAIIAGMAAPSFQNQIRQAKVKEGASALESAFKEARTQALLVQRPTRVVLTNTTADKKATVYYVKRALGDSDEKIAEYTLDKNLTITSSPSSLTAVSFSPNKAAFQGEDITGTKMDGKISVCYNAGIDKYSIKIDGNSNIINLKDGSC